MYAFDLDNKNIIPVSRDTIVDATAHQSVQSMEQVGITVAACHHDFIFDKITPPLMLRMNIGQSPHEYFYAVVSRGY